MAPAKPPKAATRGQHHDGLSRVGPAHAATALRGALFLVQAAPGAVLFRPGNGIIKAFPPNRAGGADHLGLTLPDFTLRLPLAVRAKEEHDVLASARGGILPGPARPWRHGHLPTYLRHESISLWFPCVPRPGQRHAAGHAVSRDAAFTPSSHPTRYAALVFPRIRARSAARARGTGGKSGAGRAGGGLRASRVDEASQFSRTDAQLCHPVSLSRSQARESDRPKYVHGITGRP